MNLPLLILAVLEMVKPPNNFQTVEGGYIVSINDDACARYLQNYIVIFQGNLSYLSPCRNKEILVIVVVRQQHLLV